LRGTRKIPDGDNFKASSYATALPSCRASPREAKTLLSWLFGFVTLIPTERGMNLRVEFIYRLLIKALECPRLSGAVWSLVPCLANCNIT